MKTDVFKDGTVRFNTHIRDYTAYLRKYARLFYMLMKVRLNRSMIYSFNFWMAFITDLSIFLLQVAMFSAIFLNIGTLNGWNVYQMIVFIGTFTILDASYMATYFFGVLTIPEKIRTGGLDQYIVSRWVRCFTFPSRM